MVDNNENIRCFIETLDYNDIYAEMKTAIDCFVPQPPIRRIGRNGVLETCPNGIDDADYLCIAKYDNETTTKYRLVHRNNSQKSVTHTQYTEMYINSRVFPDNSKCFTMSYWGVKYNEIIQFVTYILWFYKWYI